MATRTKIKLDPLRIDGHEVGRVLITGASAGIGAELAREFARNGHQLTLVARRRAKLAAVAAELEREHYVDVRTIVQDLAKPTGPAAVVKAAQADGPIGILVNNAGVIDVGPFAASRTDALVNLVNLNVRALTELTSLVVPGMVERGFGRILNVASLAAFQPVPSMAAYAASKAYVLALTEALSEELKGSGVTVTALCPGHHRHRHGQRDPGRFGRCREAAEAARVRPGRRRRRGVQGADGGAGRAGARPAEPDHRRLGPGDAALADALHHRLGGAPDRLVAKALSVTRADVAARAAD